MHSFDPDVAVMVGVHAAVIHQNMLWWCRKNLENGRNIFDGKAWNFSSVAALALEFPYLTEKQVRCALDRLISTGLVEVGPLKRGPYDSTKCYHAVALKEATS